MRAGETKDWLNEAQFFSQRFPVPHQRDPFEHKYWISGNMIYCEKKQTTFASNTTLNSSLLGFEHRWANVYGFINLSCNLLKNGWNGFEQVIPGVASFNGDESQGFPGKIASFFITWKANLNNCGDAPSDNGQCLSTMCIHLLSLLWVYEPQKKTTN